jgi:hypothetical protein
LKKEVETLEIKKPRSKELKILKEKLKNSDGPFMYERKQAFSRNNIQTQVGKRNKMSGGNVKKVLKNARDICSGFCLKDQDGNHVAFVLKDKSKVVFGGPVIRERFFQLFNKYKQIREISLRMDPLCVHEIAALHARIQSYKQYRLEFLSYKPIIWKEHNDMEHLLEFAINFGNISRFGEDVIERYIQVVKREDKSSVQIVEIDKRVRNTMLRSQIYSNPAFRGQFSPSKPKVRTCRRCKVKGFRDRPPYCRCRQKP